MTKRPESLTVLSAALLLTAISLPLQIMLLYQHSPLEPGAIFAKLAPLNWVILGLAPLTAWLASRASRWMLAALPSLGLVVMWNNWLVIEYGTDYSGTSVVIATAVMLLVGLKLVFNHAALTAVLNPGKRWWLTPARRKVQVPIRFKILDEAVVGRAFRELGSPTLDLTQTGNMLAPELPEQVDEAARRLQNTRSAKSEFELRTFDISRTGAFVRFEGDATHVPIGSQCLVSLPVPGDVTLVCRAEVVRKSNARGQYPAGVGIRFLDLGWSEKREIGRLLQA